MTVVYYKVNYLPVGVRIWFWPNCWIRVFGDMAKFSFSNFLKTRSRKYPKRKSSKAKNVKMLLFIICEPPQKNSTIFRPFLAIFSLFHSINWPYLQKPQLGNLAKTRFWYLLVNNSLCSIPLSWTRSYIKENPGDRCAMDGRGFKKWIDVLHF